MKQKKRYGKQKLWLMLYHGMDVHSVELNRASAKKKNSIEMMKGTFALFFICFSFFFVWIFCPSSYFVSCKACKPYSVLFIHFVLLDGGDETCRKRDDCSLGDKGFFVCVCCFSTQPTMNFSQFYFLLDRWFFVFFFYPCHSKFHFYYVTYNIWMECPWIWTCCVKKESGFLLWIVDERQRKDRENEYWSEIQHK